MNRDRALSVGLALVVFGLVWVRVLDYGLTWDEPTYLRFARLQREWIVGVTGLAGSADVDSLLTPNAIRHAWLQHPAYNGHPPLNETWMGLASAPFRWAGQSDLASMRGAVALLFGLTVGLLYALMRRRYGQVASVSGTLLFAGVPAIWAHAHLGATEIMQCFFWVALALSLPSALAGGRWPIARFVVVCALAFAAKFTDVLAIGWVLGTAAILGEWRRPRFWLVAGLGIVIGVSGLLVLDPFFWPWQGGTARYVDYLRQCVSRGQWIPIAVYYWGQNWGFRPPWHYRIVETITTLPLATVLLFVPGFGIGLASLFRQLRAQRIADWPLALGITGLGITFFVGLLPGTPNHDVTRQYVFVYLAVALVAAGFLQRLLDLEAERINLRRLVAATAIVAGVWAIGTAWRAEPFGLGYRNLMLGGTGGAWSKGFEISYWGEAITPGMLSAVDRLRRPDDTAPVIFSVPKLNYFADAEELWRPLVNAEAARRDHLAHDIRPAFYEPWVTARMKEERGEFLRMTFPMPPD
ncbi:MAG: glycosyltransferase family 39 protein, partial [Candidatus Eisenbacteria bacterium]|nr:glycosyltransferase family 39 protein [Candidatus Eisenbacteria bacterium]